MSTQFLSPAVDSPGTAVDRADKIRKYLAFIS